MDFERVKEIIVKLLSCLFSVVFLLCIIYTQELFASSKNTTILAKVNGDLIDEHALEDKLRTIHYNKMLLAPDSKASIHCVNILDVIEEMIDERLMIQEALRLGLDKEADFVRRFELFERNQLILRLRKEEVIDRISISEKDIRDYFKKFYNKEGVIDEKKFKQLRRRIEKKLRKLKEKELSEKFFAFLREKASIWIDKELVDSFNPDNDYVGREVVARVNGEPVLFNDFVYDVKEALKNKAKLFERLRDEFEREKEYKRVKKDVLNRLITYELIKQEALKRKRFYIKDRAFVDMLEKRKEIFLIDAFKAKLIYPLAIPSKDELTQYYEKNIEEFKLPNKVWFSEMCFSDRDEAEKILNELKQGADFEFLAALVSEESASRRRDYVWVQANYFSPSVKKELDRLKVGEISDVIVDGSQYKIIKLKGKKESEPIEFSKIIEKLRKIVVRKKFDKLLSDYVAKLRERSEIEIYNEAIEQIEKKYWNELPKENKNKAPTG